MPWEGRPALKNVVVVGGACIIRVVCVDRQGKQASINKLAICVKNMGRWAGSIQQNAAGVRGAYIIYVVCAGELGRQAGRL